MSISHFFDEPKSKDKQSSEEKEINNETAEKNEQPSDRQKPIKPLEEYNPEVKNPNEDIDNIFLLDVQYQSQLNLAQCVFYHPETKSLYRWNDTTGHKPYLITMMSQEGISKIDPIVKSDNFVKMEQITKYLPMEEQEMELTQIYGDNPLAIGGTTKSFRNFVDPAFEADIRYHFNYVADRELTPGTFYKVEEGELHAKSQEIDPNIKQDLLESFKEEGPEQIKMLEDYMPLLFQEIPDILRAAFDIEVASEENRMPNPSKASDQIISIAVVDSDGRRICWVLNTSFVDQESNFENVQILRFDQEISLLEDFFTEINKYPVILSFNGDNFDCPYLINRALKLGFNYSDIPLNSRRNRSDVSFEDAIHVDLHLFFRQASIRIYAFGGRYESASLDELSSTLLGEGKLEHPDVWINEMDLDTLVKYNVKDAELTLRLTQFDNNVVLDLMFILMRISKMPLFDFSRTAVSGWLQMWLIYEHRKRNYLIPRKEDILNAKGDSATSDAIIEGKKFQGAIVLDPEPGVWWNVHVLDFASLYPSIIKTRNLSYETILCNHDECKSNRVPEVNHWVCTKRRGLFAIVLGFIRDTRIKWFKPRSSDDTIPDVERRISQVIQSSLKVLINAGYGVFGSESFDFYCPPVAESTTAFARDAITKTRDFVQNELEIRVLYGDTDSVFLYQPSPDKIDRLLEWGIENIGVELGTDYEFRYVVFSGRKKNYFGITKKGNIIVKGLMGKKSNTPKIVRDHFTMILEILKNVESQNQFEQAKVKIKNKLQNLIRRLENREFSIDDASIRMVLSKNLRDYSTWTQTMQAAAQLLYAGEKVKGDIEVGDSIEFIKVSNPVQVTIPRNTNLAFEPGTIKRASVIPVQLVNEDIDLDGKPIIEVAESTFSQILTTIGMSWDDVMGIQDLNDFF